MAVQNWLHQRWNCCAPRLVPTWIYDVPNLLLFRRRVASIRYELISIIFFPHFPILIIPIPHFSFSRIASLLDFLQSGKRSQSSDSYPDGYHFIAPGIVFFFFLSFFPSNANFLMEMLINSSGRGGEERLQRVFDVSGVRKSVRKTQRCELKGNTGWKNKESKREIPLIVLHRDFVMSWLFLFFFSSSSFFLFGKKNNFTRRRKEGEFLPTKVSCRPIEQRESSPRIYLR